MTTPNNFASITVSLPYGYFITYVRVMGSMALKFKGLKIAQGESSAVTVSGGPASLLSEVHKWALAHVPLYGSRPQPY